MPNDKRISPLVDQKEFNFIQEQIIPKKSWKNVLGCVVKTIMLAILFGVVSSIAICVTYPYIKDVFQEEEEGRLTNFMRQMNTLRLASVIPDCKVEMVEETQPIIMERITDLTVEDYKKIYEELDTITDEVNRSIVSVAGIIKSVDWLQNPYETADVTSGIIIHETEDKKTLSILVRYSKIKEVNKIRVTFDVDNVVEAKLFDYDSKLDLAIIKVDESLLSEKIKHTFKVATLGESIGLSAGEPVIAVGNPNGYPLSREYGMITGKTTSAYITDNRVDLFNTDISNNNDGDGAIVNLKGEIIGIITHIHSFKSELNANINTALSITRIKPIIDALVKGRNRTYLGIIGTDLTTEIAASLGVDNGVYVNEVETESPALEAGLQTGDVILKIDDSTIISMAQLNTIISTYQPKDELTIVVKRTTSKGEEEKKELTFHVQLHKKKN
ncbi:S1C family serine protease [Anaerosporobacter faecicola]|uniref:S1C family serine protease n=1 Tax=Anaerosporobacter faecicola TaxID=2718714 RepID=UPI0014387E00|nr:PDZ domain-containing protein [Anaerosporobacter faecicola]